MPRLKRYCTCGAVLTVNVPLRKQNQLLSIWYAQHDGPGHADTNAATAARMGSSIGYGRESRNDRRR